MTEVFRLSTLPDDEVNSPKHYLSPKPIPKIYVDDDGNYYIMAIDVVKAWVIQRNAWLFNCLKYLIRAGRKDPQKLLQDLEKADYYLNEAIEEVRETLDVETTEVSVPSSFIKEMKKGRKKS